MPSDVFMSYHQGRGPQNGLVVENSVLEYFHLNSFVGSFLVPTTPISWVF